MAERAAGRTATHAGAQVLGGLIAFVVAARDAGLLEGTPSKRSPL